MKAWAYRRYGSPDVLELVDVPKPVPAPDEILVRILATTVSAGDWRARSLDLPPGFGPFGRLVFGVTRPRKPILGLELAGVVESMGRDVTRFATGDAVFALTGGKMGAHAQYQTLPEKSHVARKPGNLSFEEAAALSFGGSTALHFLDKASLRSGERVLVVGASGSVGTAVVQLAKARGAHVTAVTSTRNADLVTSLGADRIIDYTRQEFLESGAAYDVIVETVGETRFLRARRALKPGGRWLGVACTLGEMVGAPVLSLTTGRKVIVGVASEGREIAEKLAALAEEGALRPLIDHRYDFAEMREAHARVDSRRKRGNVVVTVPHDES